METVAPRAELILQLRELALELVKLEQSILEQEAAVEDMKAQRVQLAQKKIPKLLERAMTDKIGVPEMDADVVMTTKYHASIRSEWPEEQREAAFDAVEAAGGGDLIATVLSVRFGRGELEDARATAAHLRAWNEFGNRAVQIERGVHWATLTSFVTEMAKKERPLPLDVVGGRVIVEASVKYRKTAKGKK
jgi:hypothetical protein